MAGIYIHIPFCRRKCHYCNFFSVATLRWKEAFLKALFKEIVARRDYLGNEPVRTIYFGGGTPSLLKTEEIERILDLITRNYFIHENAEITLEANPDDMSSDRMKEWKNTPINRLSIGIQSFYDDDLVYLNRVHDGRQAVAAIKEAMDAGFKNMTIDLIYGIPTLTEEKWRNNLEQFFSFRIPYLSAYALTVEKKTLLDLLIQKGKYAPVDEQQSVDHFKILLEMAREHGFIHYEISNFSMEGFYSKHNSLYWLGGNYLGLGPSAHSFNGHSRQWNLSSITQYTRQEDFRETMEEKEVLTLVQRYNEYIMTSLRTIWGCDSNHINNTFGTEFRDHFLENSGKHLYAGHLTREGTRYYLTDEGKLFADGISADLFMDD